MKWCHFFSKSFTIHLEQRLGETLKLPGLSRVSEAAASRLGLGSEGIVHIPGTSTLTTVQMEGYMRKTHDTRGVQKFRRGTMADDKFIV